MTAFGLLLPVLALASQEAPAPTLRMEVDTAVVTVGDPITLMVSVEHAPEALVVWPDSLDLSPFEILGAQASGPGRRGEQALSYLTLTLAAFELGDLEIPSFPVEVVDPGGAGTSLDTNPFGIRVESVGLDESGDIRDLKGPLGLPVSPARLALLVAALVLVAAVAWALYRRFRRSGEDSGEAEPKVPPRPPHEVALEELARLEAAPLLERGEVKEYHIRASDILRTYVEERFQVPALEMTSRYIVMGLESVGVVGSTRDGFRSFLDCCDMVKFAKHRPGAPASLEVLALGRRLVEETIPEDGP